MKWFINGLLIPWQIIFWNLIWKKIKIVLKPNAVPSILCVGCLTCWCHWSFHHIIHHYLHCLPNTTEVKCLNGIHHVGHYVIFHGYHSVYVVNHLSPVKVLLRVIFWHVLHDLWTITNIHAPFTDWQQFTKIDQLMKWHKFLNLIWTKTFPYSDI